MVIGCSGTGKSTLAQTLAKKSHYPIIFLDQHYWKEGWKETPEPEWRETIKGLIKGHSWIMDGNYSGTWDLRLPVTDMVIYLDYPTYIPLFRALWRIFSQYGKTRTDMAADCPERLDWDFINYILTFRKKRRRKHITHLKEHEQTTRILIFTHPKELKLWLSSFMV